MRLVKACVKLWRRPKRLKSRKYIQRVSVFYEFDQYSQKVNHCSSEIKSMHSKRKAGTYVIKAVFKSQNFVLQFCLGLSSARA